MTQTNNEREAFELSISMEYEHPTDLARDGDGYSDGYVDNAWWGWCKALHHSKSPISQNEQQEAVGDGKYAIYFQDNWDGEADKYWTFAFKENGIWKSSETHNDLFQYEGDEILKIVPLYTQLEVTSPPKQAIPEGWIKIKKDAERYRWLREVSRDPDDGDVHCVITEEFLEKGKPAKMVSYLLFDEKLDAEIDKAMINAAPTNTEVGNEL